MNKHRLTSIPPDEYLYKRPTVVGLYNKNVLLAVVDYGTFHGSSAPRNAMMNRCNIVFGEKYRLKNIHFWEKYVVPINI